MTDAPQTASRPCTIGVDFGTESGRVLVLDLAAGAELAVEVVPYRHGVIDRSLPGGGEPLPDDWALQHPSDWTDVIEQGVPAAVAGGGSVAPIRSSGIGVDFTSCTVLPAAADGTPLCLTDRWRDRRHAWPKLWKHHAAQDVADRLNEVALRTRRAVPGSVRRPDLVGVVLPEADRGLGRGPRGLRRLRGVPGGDRLDRLVADRAARAPVDHGRLQGDVVAVRGAAADARTSRRPTPGSISRRRSSAPDFAPLGTRAGALRPELAAAARTAGDGRGGGRQRRLVRVGAGRRRRARADVRDGDRHLDLRHGRGPDRGPAAGDHRRRP